MVFKVIMAMSSLGLCDQITQIDIIMIKIKQFWNPQLLQMKG